MLFSIYVLSIFIMILPVIIELECLFVLVLIVIVGVVIRIYERF
jgi:hypothetical protein